MQLPFSNPARRGVRWACGGLALCLSCVDTSPLQARPAPADRADAVEVRRTADDIPHIKSDSWRGLGLGFGHAQAQDALCTLAESFVTYSGRRAFHFGPEGKPRGVSTFGQQATNLELDFFFQAFVDAPAVDAFKREQPPELQDLVAGFAEGYNRHLREVQQRGSASRRHACSGQPWLRAIAPEDLYRRMIAVNLAAGYARFIPEIVNAQPPTAGLPARVQGAAQGGLSLASRLSIPIGDSPVLGSNVLAFGGQATSNSGGVLFGNPHWYWGGPDRFYQAHLTVPGQLDVAGVSFLGVPVIMIGFNHDVAWSHTVSTARRFGLFELALDPQDPTRYRVDGAVEAMQAVPVAVQARRADGGVDTVRRTLYRTRFGPVVDFGRQSPAFGWGTQRALAMRDVNADNRRTLRHFFRWNRARSLDEFIAIQKEEAGMPWVNTAAIGRNDARAWYADIGAVPHVLDAQRAACAAPLSQPFAQVDRLTPLLDGSRSACDWALDPAAVQPGAMPAARLPSLIREDHVENMNDSYWLTNPAQPLTGYPSILGGERQPPTMRGREGHRIAQAAKAAGASSSLSLADWLMREGVAARSSPAVAFRTELLDGACRQAQAPEPSARRDVDLRAACEVLRRWSNGAEAADRGALLWDAWWARLQTMSTEGWYAVPFSADHPLDTPRQPNASDPRVAQALTGAIDDLAARGLAIDAPLGSQRYVKSDGRTVPLFGGCVDGHFTVICGANGQQAMGPTAMGNSYLQVVHFGRDGVQARTLLAHGQLETAVDGGPGGQPVARYARKDWLAFPFREDEIARDRELRREMLSP